MAPAAAQRLGGDRYIIKPSQRQPFVQQALARRLQRQCPPQKQSLFILVRRLPRCLTFSYSSPHNGHLGTSWEIAVAVVVGTAFGFPLPGAWLTIPHPVVVIVALISTTIFHVRRKRQRERLADTEAGSGKRSYPTTDSERLSKTESAYDAPIAKVCFLILHLGLPCSHSVASEDSCKRIETLSQTLLRPSLSKSS